MSSVDRSDISRDNGTCALTHAAGIRESRKFFSLVLGSPVTSGSDDDGSLEDLLTGLQLFLKKTWNIWGVSTMFNFNFDDDIKIKQYAKILREQVAHILSQEDVSYVATFKVLDIPKPNDSDHPVIMIKVQAQTMGKESRESCVYEGYFFSWRSGTTCEPSDNTGKLPLLLCRGTANTMRAVHSILGHMFDCLFVALPTNEEDLKWLLPILIRATEEEYKADSETEAMLEYLVPYLPTSNSITVKFHIKKLIQLWRSLWGKQDKILGEEVEKFHEILHSQAREITGLQLELCLLNKIILPSITISANKMKVTSVNAMNTVLTYLNEKAMDALYINTTQFSTSK
ncbi:PREDICTED: centromere protein L-like [Ceratosolen solmsi marchali]|uniref:Centromere protein L n=1 Tax=Ceratosolen solmsi marchali TaxID=326594 RepID=A0AAJ6YRV1_9HYME|nr:PREDICTED: centromere protein L-like [Ceratosolen solmsi marchali]